MTALDWTQIALFAAGAVVHFLYTRLVTPTSAAGTPSPGPAGANAPVAPSLPNPNEAMQVLAAIAKTVKDQQTAAPAPGLSNTEAGLLALLHKLVDQQGQPAVPPTPPTANH